MPPAGASITAVALATADGPLTLMMMLWLALAGGAATASPTRTRTGGRRSARRRSGLTAPTRPSFTHGRLRDGA